MPATYLSSTITASSGLYMLSPLYPQHECFSSYPRAWSLATASRDRNTPSGVTSHFLSLHRVQRKTRNKPVVPAQPAPANTSHPTKFPPPKDLYGPMAATIINRAYLDPPSWRDFCQPGAPCSELLCRVARLQRLCRESSDERGWVRKVSGGKVATGRTQSPTTGEEVHHKYLFRCSPACLPACLLACLLPTQ